LQGAGLCNAGPIIAVDTVPAKLTIAQEFGATHGVLAGPDTLEEIQSLTGGRGADYVFEAIGLPSVQEEAFEAARPGGTLVVVGVAPIESKTSIPGFQLHVQEKRILGSLYGSCDTRREFPLLLDLYKDGKLKLDELISREYRLEEINEAYEILLQGETKRGIIVFD